MSGFDNRFSGFYDEDGIPIPKGAISETPHCWGPKCNKSTDMRPGIGDPPYGFICNLCGNSLRQHPFFGEGCEYDIGNAQRFKGLYSIWLSSSRSFLIPYLRMNFKPHIFTS